MKAVKSHERGQALILIVFALVGMVGLTALAVDGGMAYNDRRHAQGAADSAALAAALANIRGRDISTTALTSAAAGGYNNNNVTNTVTVTIADVPAGACHGSAGKDITVQITSQVRTYFGPVVGIRVLTNTVRATARSCEPYFGPLFNGNAIVALTPSGIGFDGAGTPDWHVDNGGIFSNSSGSPSARCKGASGVYTPSLTVVGTALMQCATNIGTTQTGVSPYTYDTYKDLLPPVPQCNGNARLVGDYWDVQQGADGSNVALSGDMKFAPGLYCITNSPGPYHGQISGTWVTFYLKSPNFSIKFNGGAGFGPQLTAPENDNYASAAYIGVLMFSAPQLSGTGTLLNTQSIDLRGNGDANVVGSIIVPSASVTMFGNSGSAAYNTQVIGYNVDSGGTADININYHAHDGFQVNLPAWLTLLK